MAAHGRIDVTGASELKDRPDARFGELREVVERAPTFGPQTLFVELTRAAPQCVEHRLHAGDHSALGQRGGLGGGDHLGVFDTVAQPRQGRSPELGGHIGHGLHEHIHRPVSDDVEAGLDAGLGAGAQMSGHGLGVEIADTAGVDIDVRIAEQRRVRPDRAIDEQIAAERVGARWPPAMPWPLRRP